MAPKTRITSSNPLNNLPPMLVWDWRQSHTYSAARLRAIKEYFSPIDTETGKMRPAQQLADIIVEWSVYFFGDPTGDQVHYHINEKVPDFHRKIYLDLFNEVRYYYITVPSGMGKTTIACLIYPIYRAVYELDPYIMIGGANQQLSEDEHLDNIRRELEENEKLIMVYGDLQPSRKKTLFNRKRSWNNTELELTNGVTIRALGCMGKIRGRKSGRFRPTLVISDDPESVEDITSDSELKKHRNWLFRDVMYRVDAKHGKLRVIGNLLSDNCLMMTLIRDKRWKGSNYAALVEGKSIWEEKFPTTKLLRDRQDAIENGTYDDWMFEVMNVPPRNRHRSFQGYQVFDGRVEYVNDQHLLWIEGEEQPIIVNIGVGVDPEMETEEWGPRAFVILAKGWHRIDGHDRICTFVLEYLYKPMNPGDIVKNLSEVHQKYIIDVAAIEVNSMQVTIKNDMRHYRDENQFYRLHPFQFVPIKNTKKKIVRILRLQPLCSNGYFYIKRSMTELKTDLDYFDQQKEKGWHLLDAIEMGDRFLRPPTKNTINRIPERMAKLDALQERRAKKAAYDPYHQAVGAIPDIKF